MIPINRCFEVNLQRPTIYLEISTEIEAVLKQAKYLQRLTPFVELEQILPIKHAQYSRNPDFLSNLHEAQSLQAEKLKSNDRRASGLMAYPRIGRSDVPISNVNFNRHHVMEPDTDFQFYNAESDSVPDKDYEDPRNPTLGYLGRSMNPKHADKFPKEASWLIPDRLRSSKDYRPWQKLDDEKSAYPGSLILTRGMTRKYLPFLVLSKINEDS
ncbi:hypothetical protein WN48_10637 [Eufriesea mexicana]|uniref:Uncharacterized protein n=1 Tax=Eufriesea mexicana TaxID=516756 RepID=A0A310S910_9HYME|nr:hypothetical protein WN48_10637 [Eufriesea mexicana]